MNQEERYLKAFDLYADALFRHCYFRISDRERSLEMVQDVFARGWEYLRQGKEIINFKPFLYKILNNLIIDEYRRKRPSSLDELLESEEISEGSFPELRDESATGWADMIDAKVVHQALKEIPEMYREVVTLRFIDGLTPREIADLIEETENVVSVRIHRGLGMLRKKIKHE